MWSISVDWLWCYCTNWRQPIFDRQFFRKSLLKMKNHCSSSNFYVFSSYYCSFITCSFDYFLFNFSTLLKFWENLKIQDGGSKIIIIIRRITNNNNKLSKYKDLEIETSRMWGMRMEMIPVIIGALGAIKKGLEMYLGRIPGQISISELQKITLLGTAHILRSRCYQTKNWLPFSASGPWFGLGPKDY